MRVVARSTLRQFVEIRVQGRERTAVKKQLDAWFAEVCHATWSSSSELKQKYRSASILGSDRVVFNIKGNDYRLIVKINYAVQVVRILWIGTHGEYDKLNAREVLYEKQRYFDSTDRNRKRP